MKAMENTTQLNAKQLKEVVQLEELKTRLAKAIYENYYYRYMALQYEIKLQELENKLQQESKLPQEAKDLSNGDMEVVYPEQTTTI